MRSSLIMGAAALVAWMGCEAAKPAPKKLSAEDQAAIEGKLKAAEERAATFRKQRMQALQEAHGSRLPTSGPCPVKVPLPPEMRDASKPFDYGEDPGSEAQRWRMNIINALALRDKKPPAELKMVQEIEWKIARKGPRAWQFERQRDMLRKMAGGSELGSFKRDEALALADKLGSDDYWGWELNIVADAYNRPSYSDDKSFKSGTVLGRAYLYSFPKGRILCSGDVVAQNRKSITLEIDPKFKGEQRHQMLENDLKNVAFRVAVQQLRAVSNAPPPASTGAAAASASASAQADDKPIGVAKMAADGTLTVTLYTRGPIKAQLQKTLKKGDPKRERYLKHIGGLKPGEEKPVPPWPDNKDTQDNAAKPTPSKR